MMPIWRDPKTIAWTQILLDNYQQLLGQDLIDRRPSPLEQSALLYHAPFVVVSHGTEADPILNYGNQIAQDLWEMNWLELTQTPSRLTAEPLNREMRQQMLALVTQQGFIDNYQGVRISRQGRRFQIGQATVWNLSTADRQPIGQAATFTQWHFLPEINPPIDIV